MNKRLLLLVLFLFLGVGSELLAQGASTTSSIVGKISDKAGSGLPSATVLAIHQPTGTTYGVTTRQDGKYNLTGLKVGGPYSVSITYVGYEKQELNLGYLALGQVLTLDVSLSESSIQTSTVLIEAGRSSVLNSGKTGAATGVSNEQIQKLPTISRSFQDFSKLSPLFSGSSLSAAGRNSRLNNIQLDGTQYNDLFGLGSTGAPGGQANTNPISLDAIDEFQVVLAPFDVRFSGFTGGGINAITRSGTNVYTGSVYYYMRNQDFAGKSPDAAKTKLSNFSDNQIGFRVGGPIIQDNLFFFVNGEVTDRVQPAINLPLSNAANFFKLDSAASFLTRVLKDTFGYNPGAYLGELDRERPSMKLFARIDYNLSSAHKLTLRNNLVSASDDIIDRTSRISFADQMYTFESLTNSTVLQLNSTLSNEMSNELNIGYTIIRDKRSVENKFPTIRVKTPISGTDMYAGTEQFSIANGLDQDIFEITDNFSYYLGDHIFTVGTHNEFFTFSNLFIRNFYGYYEFNSVQDLYQRKPSRYEYRYSLTGDPKQPAKFGAVQWGFYAQDEWTVLPTLRMNIGVRLDIPTFPDAPAQNDSVTKYFGDKGYSTSKVPSGNILFSPRLGFNWDLLGDRSTIIRGGVGVFTGRVPYVWISNQYSNTGVEFADISKTTPGFFVTDVNAQPKAGTSGLTAGSSTEINITDPDFKLPQVFRLNLGVDQKLPFNFTGSVDVLYTKSVNDPIYEDLNISGITDTLKDGRYYWGKRAASYFQRVMLLKNYSDASQTNISAQIQGEPIDNLNLNLGYAFGSAQDRNSVTSSQARSQFRYNLVPGNPNDPPLTTSNFEIRNRLFAAISYSYEWYPNAVTTISLFYNGQSGRPYSYFINGDVNGDGHDANDLLYIPSDLTDLNDKYIMTASEATLFLSYIERDEYLKENKGKIAERNGSREPWSEQIDLRLSQEVPSIMGHKFEITLDILNVANLINGDWGHLKYVPNQSDALLRLTSFDAATNKLKVTYSDKVDPLQKDNLLSRWQMQLGVRYTF